MVRDPQKEGEYNASNNKRIIDKNWKALIKPNKLRYFTSNEDKTIAKVSS